MREREGEGTATCQAQSVRMIEREPHSFFLSPPGHILFPAYLCLTESGFFKENQNHFEGSQKHQLQSMSMMEPDEASFFLWEILSFFFLIEIWMPLPSLGNKTVFFYGPRLLLI